MQVRRVEIAQPHLERGARRTGSAVASLLCWMPLGLLVAGGLSGAPPASADPGGLRSAAIAAASGEIGFVAPPGLIQNGPATPGAARPAGGYTAETLYAELQAQRVSLRRERPNVDLQIGFAFDSAELTADACGDLDAAGEVLAERLSRERVLLAGHTDRVGTEEFNQVLSERRAAAARDYLVERHGIDPSRIEIVGYGESSPLDPRDSREARRKNRRVNLEMLP